MCDHGICCTMRAREGADALLCFVVLCLALWGDQTLRSQVTELERQQSDLVEKELLLEKYHTWLRAIPLEAGRDDDNGDGASAGRDGEAEPGLGAAT